MWRRKTPGGVGNEACETCPANSEGTDWPDCLSMSPGLLQSSYEPPSANCTRKLDYIIDKFESSALDIDSDIFLSHAYAFK